MLRRTSPKVSPHVLARSLHSKSLIGPPSVSFAGCAWLFPYHLGVIEALRSEAAFKQALYLGASSGSLAAVIAALDIDTAPIMEHCLEFARDARERSLGPIGRMSRYVSQGLQQQLPKDAWQRVAGRVKISVTLLPHLRHELIDASSCHSQADLIRLLLGSCYIPIYYEKPVVWGWRVMIDGGLRNNQPRLNAQTICVSPQGSTTQQKVDIFPEQRSSLLHVLFPEPSRLQDLYASGKTDGEAWLKASFLTAQR